MLNLNSTQMHVYILGEVRVAISLLLLKDNVVKVHHRGTILFPQPRDTLPSSIEHS